MKKITFVIALMFMCMSSIQAQLNIQLHRDFGREIYSSELDGGKRPLLTTTVEMFRPDKYGSTFFFVDMDYTSDGVDAAYWEIARNFRFWNAPIEAHIEYNGGLNDFMKFTNQYLVGPSYSWNAKDFSRGFTLTAMYKYIQSSEINTAAGPMRTEAQNSFQLTAVWYWNFLKNKLTFNGFIDYWKEKNLHGDYIFMSEPQLWLNLAAFKAIPDNINISVGGEVELTNNFAGRDGFYAIPTVGVKWGF